ncbi:MAG: hypothetical protein IPK79_10035 [Vampirovibrionales bacterium]|nr:hypothetical protein [Vampirovibrionales bacterium]
MDVSIPPHFGARQASQKNRRMQAAALAGALSAAAGPSAAQSVDPNVTCATFKLGPTTLFEQPAGSKYAYKGVLPLIKPNTPEGDEVVNKIAEAINRIDGLNVTGKDITDAFKAGQYSGEYTGTDQRPTENAPLWKEAHHYGKFSFSPKRNDGKLGTPVYGVPGTEVSLVYDYVDYGATREIPVLRKAFVKFPGLPDTVLAPTTGMDQQDVRIVFNVDGDKSIHIPGTEETENSPNPGVPVCVYKYY